MSEMTQEKATAPERVYPAPTVVVGVGRTGLAVVERLGEDWMMLRQSGGDASLRNLRLLWVHPSADCCDADWCGREQQAIRIARCVGESDLPSLAVNLVILRSLGLVRFRDGSYQVALPKDAGPVEKQPDKASKEEAAGAERGNGRGSRIVRRRYFEWLSLSPDPIIAVERLYRLAEGSSELDTFIMPIVNRVRQGHSPRALLACIGRCQALAEGRDPSPWSWVKPLGQAASAGPRGERRMRIGAQLGEAKRHLRLCETDYRPIFRPAPGDPPEVPLLALLDTYAPPPVANWQAWLRQLDAQGGGSVAPEAAQELLLRIPGPFVPRREDVELWLDPQELLKVDWETTGWATSELGGADSVQFTPAEASPFRLGLFDHDGSQRTEHGGDEELAARLRLLADLTRRGLIRLWVDLQRNRVEERESTLPAGRRREGGDEAQRQSLEILGELLVRPVAAAEEAAEENPPAPPVPAAAEPSNLLSRLIVVEPRRGNAVERQLAERLAALELGNGAARDDDAHPLLRRVALTPADVGTASDPAETAGSLEPADTSPGLMALCRELNRQVRELYRLSFLREYRTQPLRRPPRLTIYLVGDMAEPFARCSFRTLLREIHAELLRAFSPIFEHYREGFDRALSVVPIIWMPHPADPLEGEEPERRQQEEAAIIDAVQGIRRWVESVIPAARRRVSQIFINSRVTDTSVLSLRDAVRQTRDFITFQCRNEICGDEWLRRIAVGPQGDDFFSSFSCYEIEFPAEKAREYLANRLARKLLRKIKGDQGEQGLPPPEIAGKDRSEVTARDLAPPERQGLVGDARSKLRRQTEAAADEIAQTVENRVAVDRRTTARELRQRFDEGFGTQLRGRIGEVWERLTQRRGDMDEMVDELRRRASAPLDKVLEKVRDEGDRLVGELAKKVGITAAVAAFNELGSGTREIVECQESQRLKEEQLCVRHRIPEQGPLEAARKQVVEAAERKPDDEPMRAGLILWVLLAPVVAAPLCHAVAYYFRLHEEPNWFEPLLGPFAPLTGGLLVALGGWWFLRRTMDRALRAVREAIAGMTRAGRRIVEGSGNAPESETSPSVHSFLATRLDLTAALATRAFALRVFERVRADRRLVDRLARSVEIQAHLLAKAAEELGMRPQMRSVGGGEPAAGDEDVRNLFATRSGERTETLIRPQSLVDFFASRQGADSEVKALIGDFLDQVDALTGWRQSAALADGERILGFCRERFAALVGKGIADQLAFTDEAGRELVAFVHRHWANIGFGAKFAGSEGLDPDGVHLVAEAALVLRPELRAVFERARRTEPDCNRTMAIIPCRVRPNTAYMLSLAQGIRPHSVRNLSRFESFHDRPYMPEDRTFPLSGDEHQGSINHMSTYRLLADDLSARFPVNGSDDEPGGDEP